VSAKGKYFNDSGTWMRGCRLEALKLLGGGEGGQHRLWARLLAMKAHQALSFATAMNTHKKATQTPSHGPHMVASVQVVVSKDLPVTAQHVLTPPDVNQAAV